MPNGASPGGCRPHVSAGSLSQRKQPELRVGGLLLRPWRDLDAPAVVRAYEDPDIQQWHARSMTADEALVWVRSWHDRWQEETAAGWAVTEQGSLVGRAGIQRLDLHEGLAEVAYWVVPAARGRGVATAAAEVVIGWAFEQLGLHRLELTHAVDNVASCRTAAKLGFRFEGVMRQHALHLDGWHDMHLHSLLEDDEREPTLQRERTWPAPCDLVPPATERGSTRSKPRRAKREKRRSSVFAGNP